MSNQGNQARVSRREVAQFVNERLDRPMTNPQMVEVVDTVFDVISELIMAGKQPAIPGFGKFGKRTYSARKARNPKTGEQIEMPAFSTPYFRASALLRKAVR